MKDLGSEVAGDGNCKKRETCFGRATIRFECSGNRKCFYLGCESTNVSVERLGKDKDADENVDADQVRTVRPVESEQSIGLFTQREEIDIDFRVSGLPHAVVTQGENFSVRDPHREALQADLQQNNAYNPFSDESKAMIREMGNVELDSVHSELKVFRCELKMSSI